jgi:hypothetical protein
VVVIKHCNFKKISPSAFKAALLRSWDWPATYALTDVNKVLEHINGGLLAALNIVAPLRSITVRRGKNLYLAADTLAVMKMRDKASGADYRLLRNRASVLVRRDKRRSNMALLEKAKGNSRALWELANDAIGKPRPTLQKAIEISDDNKLLTVGPAAAPNSMNDYYIQKVLKLREPNVGCTPPATSWPKRSSKFSFSHCTANKIAKVIRGLGSTTVVQERCRGAGRTYITFSELQL